MSGGVKRVQSMSVHQLKALLDSGESFFLLDVRTRGELRIASLEGARRLDEAAETELLTLERTARLVFVCHHGIRSRAAAERFLAQGFHDVHNVEGGIDAWAREIDPSVPRY